MIQSTRDRTTQKALSTIGSRLGATMQKLDVETSYTDIDPKTVVVLQDLKGIVSDLAKSLNDITTLLLGDACANDVAIVSSGSEVGGEADTTSEERPAKKVKVMAVSDEDIGEGKTVDAEVETFSAAAAAAAAAVAAPSSSEGGTVAATLKKPPAPLNDELVVDFFNTVYRMFEEGKYDYDGYIKDMIEKYPDLVSIDCPKGLAEGTSLLECLLLSTPWRNHRAKVTDLMYKLVLDGAVATDVCYYILYNGDPADVVDMDMDMTLVLVLSGFMPVEHKDWDCLPDAFMLDTMFEKCSHPDAIDEVLKVLLRNVKPGDKLSCVKVTQEIVTNLKLLPELGDGITHIAGGDFAMYLRKYLRKEQT